MQIKDSFEAYDESTLPPSLRRGDSLLNVRGGMVKYRELRAFRRINVLGFFDRTTSSPDIMDVPARPEPRARRPRIEISEPAPRRPKVETTPQPHVDLPQPSVEALEKVRVLQALLERLEGTPEGKKPK